MSNLTINAGVRWERQKSAIATADGFRSRRQLGAAYRRHLGLRAGTAAASCSRTTAASTRASRWTSTSARSAASCCFCYNFDPNPRQHVADAGSAVAVALLGGADAGRSEPEGPVHRRVPRRLRVRGCAEPRGRRQVHLPGARPRDRGLPGAREGDYFIANPAGPRPEMAFYDYMRTAPAPKAKRTRRQRSSCTPGSASATTGSSSPATSGRARRQLRRHVPELDRPARSEHQLGVRLRRLPGQRAGSAEQRAHAPVQVRRQLRVLQRSLDGLNFGLSTHWYSGLPLNAYGYSFAYQNWEYYLAPRGSLGTGPSDWEADVQVGYPIRFGATRG